MMELELVPKEAFDRSAVQEANEEQPEYIGPERRRGPRRIVVDRREMIRFETRDDRRSGNDRRLELQLWDGRDT